MDFMAEKKTKAVGRPSKEMAGERDLRDKIMEEAVVLFSRKGINSTSLKEISEAAGATPAVIYYHFQSREKLILETLDTYYLPLFKDVWAAVEESDDLLWIITEMQRRLIGHAINVPWFLSLWSREFVNIGGILWAYAPLRLPARILNSFIEKIRQGQREGKLNPDVSPEMLYMSILGETLIPLKGLSSWGLLFKNKIDIETIVQHVNSMLLYGLRGNKINGLERLLSAELRPPLAGLG